MPDTPAIPAGEVVARQLPHLRERRKMSQRQLSRALAAIRFPITHPTIARTEMGQRSVTLDETLALAAVLGVSPVHLFVPQFEHVDLAITPDVRVNPRQARQWVRGQRPLPGQDDDEYQGQREANAPSGPTLPTTVRVILRRVQQLVTATIRDDRNAMADEVEAINDLLDKLRTADEARRAPVHEEPAAALADQLQDSLDRIRERDAETHA